MMVCTPEPIIFAYQLAGRTIPVQHADREPGPSLDRIAETCLTVPRSIIQTVLYSSWKAMCSLQILYTDIKLHHKLNSLTYRYYRWGEKRKSVIDISDNIHTSLAVIPQMSKQW